MLSVRGFFLKRCGHDDWLKAFLREFWKLLPKFSNFNRLQTKVDRIAWKELKRTINLSLHISDPVKFWGTLPADDNAPLLWQAYVDKAFNNEILALDVKCKNNEWGCKWEGEFQNYQVS